MSLSDKHEGKILVPWFCSQEWKHVYHLIYSDNSNDHTRSEALSILKIWKTRQVLLSSGVEGTLIILNALLTESKNLDEESVCLLYATSVMRFLNLCAANNRKQGTFYETARRNNLPSWLINIRHDFAHDQKVPSKFMLQYCLNYCLEWLKKEYWDVQYGIIRDFVALNKIGKKPHVEKYVTLYEDVVQEVLERGTKTLAELNCDLVEKLYSSFKSSNLNDHSSIPYILIVLSKAIVPVVVATRQEEFAEHVANELLKRGYLFEIADEEISVINGEMLIPNKILLLWLPLIQKLCENNMSFTFFTLLYRITNNESCDLKMRKLTAVWLNTIFRILHNVQISEGINNPAYDFNLNSHHRIWEDLRKLQSEVLKCPNSFTPVFIESLLSLNEGSRDYISEIKSLVIAFTQTNGTRKPLEQNGVHTLNEITSMFVNVDIEDEQHDEGRHTQRNHAENNSSKKWCAVEDTSMFAGCPLGVLSHQKRTRNPLL